LGGILTRVGIHPRVRWWADKTPESCFLCRGLVVGGLVEVSRAYTCWHTFMGGTHTASFHHEPRRVARGRWVAQWVRRLPSVWLGSNIQSSLEVTHV
jgi:hypothetical protein